MNLRGEKLKSFESVCTPTKVFRVPAFTDGLGFSGDVTCFSFYVQRLHWACFSLCDVEGCFSQTLRSAEFKNMWHSP